MMIDVYCRDRKCPICNSNMTYSNVRVESLKCQSNCYFIVGFKNESTYVSVHNYIGNSVIGLYLSNNDQKDALIWKKKKIERMIKFWKDNERYLMRILGGSK